MRPPLCEGCRANGWVDGREKVAVELGVIGDEREKWKAAMGVTMATRDVLVEDIARTSLRIKDAVRRLEEIGQRVRLLADLSGPALRFHAGLTAADLSRLTDAIR